MCTRIGKAKRKFSEICKSWSAYNRSNLCCISVAKLRKPFANEESLKKNSVGCCEALLMILKTKRMY
jgi:hypothetical protein